MISTNHNVHFMLAVTIDGQHTGYLNDAIDMALATYEPINQLEYE